MGINAVILGMNANALFKAENHLLLNIFVIDKIILIMYIRINQLYYGKVLRRHHKRKGALVCGVFCVSTRNSFGTTVLNTL